MTGAEMRRRSRFGSVEQRGSRFRAIYRVDGRKFYGPRPFPTAADAWRYLATVEADLIRGTWATAAKADVPTLTDYGTDWIEQRTGLKTSTRVQYRLDFRRHIDPYLGRFTLDAITPVLVRQWYAELGEDLLEQLARDTRRSQATTRNGAATTARSYRLLRTIMGTAVDDDLLPSNPCRMRGAGTASAAERPTLSHKEIAALADTVPPHYRALVIVAAYAGPRIGEIAALRLRDLRLGTRPALTIRERAYRVAGQLEFDAPKSRAGRRTVALPRFVADDLSAHLRDHRVGAGPEDIVFVTRTGRPILDTYSQVLSRGLARIGRPDARVHDLRHSGSLLAAEAGATLAELMQRLGHGSVDAAAVYLHASEDHGRAVADEMERRASAALDMTADPASRLPATGPSRSR